MTEDEMLAELQEIATAPIEITSIGGDREAEIREEAGRIFDRMAEIADTREDRMVSPAEAVASLAAEEITRPDPNITGPCEVQATFMCTQEGAQRLNPLAMLPGSALKPVYTLICPACIDHLSDAYVRTLHGSTS